ncbi:MAG: hypothetical protein L3J16_03835 [Anaerolineales bacterium]|nr:hypothetical protein [Anaerolineales bacterium]
MDSFDFEGLAILFAGISMGIIGVFMAGGAFWPELSERYKKQIGGVIVGVVLVAVASQIISALGG